MTTECPLSPEVARKAIADCQAAQEAGALRPALSSFLPADVEPAARRYWMATGSGPSNFVSFIHSVAKGR